MNSNWMRGFTSDYSVKAFIERLESEQFEDRRDAVKALEAISRYRPELETMLDVVIEARINRADW